LGSPKTTIDTFNASIAKTNRESTARSVASFVDEAEEEDIDVVGSGRSEGGSAGFVIVFSVWVTLDVRDSRAVWSATPQKLFL
jgi:hypothetical protein